MRMCNEGVKFEKAVNVASGKPSPLVCLQFRPGFSTIFRVSKTPFTFVGRSSRVACGGDWRKVKPRQLRINDGFCSKLNNAYIYSYEIVK